MKNMRTRLFFIVLVGLPILLTACQYLHETVIPLKMQKYELSKNKATLLIMIPGIADNEQTFFAEGFIDAIKQHGSEVDVISAHVHLGYLINNTFAERIEQDIILPAREEGYKRIWLVGISLGGFVAANYFQARPGDISGAVLLAPFLGKESEIKILKQAGGISAWEPNNIENESRALKLWSWYKRQAKHNKLNNIYLGYGNEDHLITGIEQFTQLLPHENISVVEGGHNWHSWLDLWQQFLAKKVIK